MKRALLAVVLLASTLGAQDKPRVTRAMLATVEGSVDKRINSWFRRDSAFDLLGTTRGVYLENYGVVFSAEVDLLPVGILAFRGPLKPAEVTTLRENKLAKLAVLRKAMREMLLDAAATLDTVPGNEQVGLAITLFYHAFEKREGLPGQVLYQAPRQVLLDYRAQRIDEKALTSALRIEEF